MKFRYYFVIKSIKGCVNMLKLIKGRLKNFIGIIALACFLCSPVSYAVQLSTVSAAPRHEEKHDPPPPPPKHDKHDKADDDNDYDKGDITAAVLIGGVIGAVIAKNT